MKKRKTRKKLSLLEVAGLFSDEATAEQWFIEQRWLNGVTCPRCSHENVTERTSARGKRAWRCNGCRKDFSTKLGTLMQGSNLPFSTWALAIYLITMNIKGIASTRLGSDLSITQKSAWHLSMRIRETYNDNIAQLDGEVEIEIEIDEAYMGGKEKNKHAHKKLNAGRGAVGKTAVIGMKERGGKIKARPVANVNLKTTHDFVKSGVVSGSQLYTDDARHWTAGVMGYEHASVNHSARVRER